MPLDARTEEDRRPWRRKMPVTCHNVPHGFPAEVKIETVNVKYDSPLYRKFQKEHIILSR
jgi:hypothetical protein